MNDQPRAETGPQEQSLSTSISQEINNINFTEIFAAIYRSRIAIAAIVVLCLVIGLLVTVLTTKQYEGLVFVEVRQEAEKVLGTEADIEGVTNKVDVDRFLDTQLAIVRSRTVVVDVANDLGLFKGGFLETMEVSDEPKPGKFLTTEQSRQELVIETLIDNLEVSYPGRTRVMQIRFVSPDPKLSVDVANSFAKNYIRNNLSRKSQSSDYALNFLRDQLRQAQSRLELSERDALQYSERARIVDTSNASGNSNDGESARPQSLVTAQLVQLNEAYSEAVANRIAAEQTWARASNASILSISEVVDNQAVQRLLEEKAKAEAEYQLQLATRKEDYPTVRQAAARVAEISDQLASLTGGIRASIRGKYQVALQQENELQRNIDRLKDTTLTEQTRGIQLSILRREADTNRQQYEALLKRFNQLNAESGVQANNLAIVDLAAIQPEPVEPSLLKSLAIALIAGLVLSGGYVFAQIQLFERVRTPLDIKDGVGVPLLGVVPISENVLDDLRDQKSSVGEAFNLIRTSVSLSFDSQSGVVVAVSSCQASEGKTSSCLALAVAFARLDRRVLIVDLDLRRPNVHRMLELSSKIGASSILGGIVDVAGSIQPSGIAGLDVITAGPIPPSPTDLIMGRNFDELLSTLKGQYDIVFVDAPPVLALADAEIIARAADGVVFIMESGRNSRRAAVGSMDRLRRSGGRILGAILTKYDPAQSGYSYSQDYSYGYSSDYSYGKRAGDDE